MPGMGMDPMAMSQGMFNNFGGAGMMNGMNMGMGFDAGQGAFGGDFNGQPQGAWNSGGQNKFNQNTFGGGNFAANAGYGAGYNMPPHQGNYNQMHQTNYAQNDFHQHGYHNQGFYRGRGRGRGGYPYSARGRGNYQVNHNFHANNAASSQQTPQGPVRRGSPVYTPMNGATADTDVQAKPEEPIRDEFAPGDAEDRAEEEAALKAKEGADKEHPTPAQEDNKDQATEGAEQTQTQIEVPHSEDVSKPVDDQHSVPDSISQANPKDVQLPASESASSAMPPPPSPSIPTGPSRKFPGDASAGIHGFGRGRGYTSGPDHSKGLSARGFTRIPNGEATHVPPIAHVEKAFSPPSEPRGLGVVGAPTGPKAMRQPPHVGPIKPDPGFSIVGRASATRAGTDSKAKRLVLET